MRRLTICLVLAALVIPSELSAGLPKYKVKRQDVEKLSPGMRSTFAGLQYFLNGYQIRQFLSLPNKKQRVEWLRRFWLMRDPTPTTPENEMEKEHNIRIKLARQYYGSRKWPGWDKRGEVFVRYGPPDYRGKIYGEVTVNRRMTPPGETWYYRRHQMLISFQNFGLKGEYIYSINALGAGQDISPELADFLLYDTNEPLSSQIPQNLLEPYAAPDYTPIPDAATRNTATEQAYLLARGPRPLDDRIDAIMDPDVADMLPKDLSAVFQKDQITKIANNFEVVLEETPSSYPFNFDIKELRFYFGVDQFRGGGDKNRVDVAVEIPVIIESSANVSFEETFHVELVVWDAEYNEVWRGERNITLRTGPDVARYANLLPTQFVLSLKRGHYRMAISAKGLLGGNSSSFRTSFTCEPYDDSPVLSDIIFARKITPAEKPTVFTRGALEVVPHPNHAYRRTSPIPIYFEVYNITLDDRGVATYTIEYKITPHSGNKKGLWERFKESSPTASSRFQASGFSENDIQHLLINVENLREGSYDLLITLTNDFTGQVTLRRSAFSLVE